MARNREKWIKIVSGLLAKAHGTDNAEERDAFMAKATELMQTHKLELEDVEVTTETFVQRIVKKVPVPFCYAEWCMVLTANVAAYVGAKAFRIKNKVMLIGRDLETELAEQIVVSLVNQLREEGKRLPAVTRNKPDLMYNFYYAAVGQISHRLAEMKAALESDDRVNAIMRVDELAIDEMLKSKGMHVQPYQAEGLRQSRRGGLSVAEYMAILQGRMAGQNARITEGLEDAKD